MIPKRPELLAPAGSRLALEAAIEGGADAVYLGASAFNARLRAGNFTDEEMGEALRLCAAYGVRTYVTLNTHLFDDELNVALRLSARLYEQGADALIVADMGIASLIKKYIPELELHASTQLSGHSVCDAKALQSAGFSRMVCHREIDRAALKLLCERSPVEIEMFIHGAYCVSFSGQCLMSAVMGGRSGNRGECAQPCRQPYYKDGRKGYPISLKDMCLGGHIKEICDSGVASLKIEGRQKPAEYVYGVCSIYRRLIDENRNADEEELEALRRIFSRDGFSDGYYRSNGASMRGVRTYEDFLAMDKTKFAGLEKKVPLEMTLRAKDGEKGRLCVRSPHGEAVSETEQALCGGTVSPLSYEGAVKNASRLGGTPFELRSLAFDADSAAPLTLSELNRLRRKAVAALSDISRSTCSVPEISCGGKKPSAGGKIMYTAEFCSESQITDAAKSFFSRIYLPLGADGDGRYDLSLPPYMPDGTVEYVLRAMAGRRVLCHGIGQLTEAKKYAAEVACSLRMNIFNHAAADALGIGCAFITAAPEVRLSKIRHMSSPCPVAATVYGRLPLMLCIRCAISDGGEKCRHSCGLSLPGKTKADPSICRSEISDRHHVTFPVFGMPDCTNIIYNSVPVYMADKTDDIISAGVSVMHFIFTDETPEECDRIITAYKKQLPPSDGAAVRRLR